MKELFQLINTDVTCGSAFGLGFAIALLFDFVIDFIASIMEFLFRDDEEKGVKL